MSNREFRRSLLGALSLGAMIAGAQPALAQQAAPAADSAETGDSNDIIVSARRRDEALQDTPVAITAINASMLENKATTNIGDLQGAAPNLLITQQNSGAQAANLSIRGLTYADIEKSQEPTVGVVVDGVFIGTNTGQLLDFFDIEQIEVLRGPQGTLFGRNTIGGVINIRRTRPTMETGAKLEGSYGRFNTWSGRAVVNLGLGDTVGIKGFYFHNQSDGFYRNAVTGKRDGGSNNENFGASILVKPPEADWDFLLTVEKQQQQFDVVNSNIARTGELFCNFEPANQCNRNTTSDLYTVFTSPGTSRYSAPSVTGELNWDIGDVKLTSITGYRKSREFQTQDFDASTADLYYVQRQQRYRQFSQEVRLSGNFTEHFDYVVGGYYFNSRYNLLQYTRLFAFNPTIPPATADTNPQSVQGKTKSYAFFGDFNLSLTDQLRLSFGGRYTHDKKSLSNSFAQTGLIGQGSGSFNKFTPKVGLDYRPNEDTMFYASWSRGYRSGGFSPRAATASTASTPYGPETVDSYEIGTKLDLFDRKLQFNVAAFYSDYKNLQQNTTIPGGPTGNQTITSNVGKATIKGIEVDAAFRPTTGLRLTATAGYLDSKFKGFVAGNSIGNVLPTFIGTTPPGAAAVLAGPLAGAYTATPTLLDYSRNNLIYSPKFSGSLGADYTIPTSFGEIIANVGYRYIGRYDQQISLGPITGTLPNAAVVDGAVVVTQPATPLVVNGNDPRVRSDKQGLLDASLTTKFKLAGTDAYFTVFGRNLANDRGTSAAFTVAGLWSFASAREPRTYGATIGVKF
jgi:iron complex outermembrane receptor protein